MSDKIFRFELRGPTVGDEDWNLENDELNSFDLVPGAVAPEVREKYDRARMEIVWEESCIAVAEARLVTVSWAFCAGNVASGGADHYIAVRLLERRDHPIWRDLPWGELPVLGVFYAWDHYFTPRPRTSDEIRVFDRNSLWHHLETGWESGYLDV